MRTLSFDEMKAARATAIHECGHFLVAAHSGLCPSIGLLTPRDGFCSFDRPPNPEVAEALCWAGIMAEDLQGCRTHNRSVPATVLTEETLAKWITEVKEAEGRDNVPWLSASDRSHISGYNQRRSIPQGVYFILAEHKDELAELADYALALFTPSIARNRGLDFNVLKAAMAQVGGSPYQKADSAGERLAPLELDCRTLEKAAQDAATASHRFASDLDRLGALATPEAHRQAADLHFTAAKLFLEAKRAAEAFNVGWAQEFSDSVAAGDKNAAHHASWIIDIRKPISLKRSADRELQQMFKHRKQP